MSLDEAKKYLKVGRILEIADKFFQTYASISGSLFLPYPKETLIEGLDIMSKYCSDSGDKKLATLIQDTMWGYLPTR